MKYLQPRSLTWWSSVIPLLAGLIVAASAGVPQLGAVASIIDAASGGLSAPVLINMGLVGIGLRGAIK
jgi:hypothetical protein